MELLGEVRVVGPGGAVARFRDRKCLELLALLALQPSGRTRDELGEALWPETPEKTQRDRLRYTLTMARRGFEAESEIIRSQGNTSLGLTDALSCDVLAWRHQAHVALREPSAPRRVELLEALLERGFFEPLPGFLADWAEGERRRFEAEQAESTVALASALAEIGRWDRALHWVRLGEERFPGQGDWDEIAARIEDAPVGSSAGDGFFGRTDEFSFLRKWLRAPERVERLITITGPGGMGKTRLAREASAGVALVWVGLADCNEPGRAWEALRLALDLAPTDAPRDSIVARLCEPDAPRILLLDNLEQLGSHAGQLAGDLLQSCPALSLLCTSQRRLDAPEERELILGPLSTRHGFDLFLSRARQERHDFAARDGSESVVRDICKLLEGVPLAIELAAARAGLLGPAQMLGQLTDALRFLTTRRPDLPERHRSVRAALDWSVGLLTESARQTLGKLSVFRGGCSPEAALAVCGPEALDDLEELEACSIITKTYESDSEYTFFRMNGFLCELLRTDNLQHSLIDIEKYLVFYLDLFKIMEKNREKGLGNKNKLVINLEILNIRNVISYCLDKNDEDFTMIIVKNILRVLYDLGYWVDFQEISNHCQMVEKNSSKISIFGFLGAIYRSLGDEALAVQYWRQRLDCAMQDNNLDFIIDTKVDLANLYISLGDWDTAIDMLKSYNSNEIRIDDGYLIKLIIFEIEKFNFYHDVISMDNRLESLAAIESRLNSGEKMYVLLRLSSMYKRSNKLEDCLICSVKGLRICMEVKMMYPSAYFLENIFSIFSIQKENELMVHTSWICACINVMLDSRNKNKALEHWYAIPEIYRKKLWYDPLSIEDKDFSWDKEIASLLRAISQKSDLANVLQTQGRYSSVA